MKCSLFHFASGTSLFAHIIAQHSLSVYVPVLSGFMVGEDCVAFVVQKHYINRWLSPAFPRKKVKFSGAALNVSSSRTMAEVLETEEEAVVTLQEKSGETCIRALFTLRGAGRHGDEIDSVIRPLLQHKHQHSRDEIHKADTQAVTDGADPKTSVPQEPELAGRDEAGCSGSVRSLCSNSSRHECPICSELFDSRGDHRITLLNCDHALCHHCTAGIMRRGKDPGRLRCPFCRQTTPLPEWEIRRMQEESFSGGVYDPGPALVTHPGPELRAVPPLERQLEVHTHICGCCSYRPCFVRGWRQMRLHSLCLSITALLLLLLVLLGCFLYMVVPLIMQSTLF